MHTYIHRCAYIAQDLPRHRHSDPRLSVSFQSQTRWMAGEWKSWLKPKRLPPSPFVLPSDECAPPDCSRPPLYLERANHPRVILHFLLVSPPLAVVSYPSKYKYVLKVLKYLPADRNVALTFSGMKVRVKIILEK